MPTDFSQVYSWLQTLEDRVLRGAHDGLTRGAARLQNEAESTTAYNDDTGGTRAGTVAAVISTLDDGSGVLQAAAQAADDKNPGHGEQHVELEPQEGVVAVVLTSQTDYAWALEVTHAGAHAFITPTMQQQGPSLTRDAADGIREAIER